ncbi:MAG TPA: DUF2846 domain-containing protein [Gemmataceae bacterium]|jgi:hypothetical protein|nr:DUF2846 domain-containing protein [Gemmataceae bacterium]
MRRLRFSHQGLWSRRRLKCASGLLLIAAGCAELPATVQFPAALPPVPAGQARIWLYRDWEPSESLNLANIDVNGGYFGSVANGGVLYRDVSPGHYHIAPQSYGQDFNQDKDVDLAAGEQVYCSVASLRSWEEGGDVGVFERDTFYIRLMTPDVARAAIARSRSS